MEPVVEAGSDLADVAAGLPDRDEGFAGERVEALVGEVGVKRLEGGVDHTERDGGHATSPMSRSVAQSNGGRSLVAVTQ